MDEPTYSPTFIRQATRRFVNVVLKNVTKRLKNDAGNLDEIDQLCNDIYNTAKKITPAFFPEMKYETFEFKYLGDPNVSLLDV